MKIDMDKEVDSIIKPISHMTNSAPQWVAVLLIVVSFVVFLWAEGQQDLAALSIKDHSTALRIDQCHDVQIETAQRTSDAMNTMAIALKEQSQMFRDFTRELEYHRINDWKEK